MIEYTEDISRISADQIEGFFVGWPAGPTPEEHLTALSGCWRAIVALDGDRVVGFVNIISDGVLTAFIPWLEVLPSYQGRGIGTELMQRALDATADMYSVDLICDAPLQPYYARLGATAIPGMGWRNHDAFGGACGGGRESNPPDGESPPQRF